MNPKRTVLIIVFFLVPLYITQLLAGGEWYKLYEDGIEAMEDGDYKAASDLFIQAIQDNPDDDENVRTYGMHSIEYFPHRELGICLYHLGDKTGAQMELQISMKMEPSDRAKQYLAQLGAGLPPAKKTEPEEDVAVGVAAASAVEQKKETEMIVGKQTIKLVGERMGVAVLPFENKGASRDLGEIILDKMITVLWTQERFKVMERAALNQVLAEQSLGQSGALDATTAAEIGKGIGVDAIVIGSVAAAPSGALSIDTRVIDTESAAIIVAHDAYTGSSDAQSVKNAVENLARKITESLPLVDGYVIRIDGTELIIDVGRNGGMKKGMKCVIYKEGAPIKHPITGEILGKETDVIGEVLVTDAFDKYSVAKQLSLAGGTISIGDKFITK
jgi:curli biogenesis system outer membrane secretion channel CsgG